MSIKQSFSFQLNEEIEKLLGSLDFQSKIDFARLAISNNCGIGFSIDNLDFIKEISSHIKNTFSLAIIVSIGGSLSSSKSYTASRNYRSKDFKLIYSDSLNKEKLEEIYTRETLERAAIIVISKSGNSVETLYQTDLFIAKYKEYFGDDYFLGKHFFFITSDKNLSQKAISINAAVYDYYCGSGKFSSFSLVSLLPASLINLDPKQILRGALDVFNAPESCIRASLAQYFLMNQNYNISVMSFYNQLLEQMFVRYMQISGEIVAKEGKGFSCLVSNSILDQHSLWQLFLSGPKDKYFTFIMSEADEQSNNFSQILAKTYHEFNIVRLKKRNIPYRVLKLAKLDSYHLGAMSMHFLMELIMLASIMNVSVVSQQDIEDSKLFLSNVYYNNSLNS